MKVLPECNEVSGWYDPISTDAFRRIMTACIDKKIEIFIEMNNNNPFEFSNLREETTDEKAKKRLKGRDGGMDDFDELEEANEEEEEEIFNKKLKQLKFLLDLDDKSILNYNTIEEYSAHYSNFYNCPPQFNLLDNEFFYLKKFLLLSDEEIIYSEINPADIIPRNPLSRIFLEQQSQAATNTPPSSTNIDSNALASVVAATSSALFSSPNLEPQTTINKRDYFYRIEQAIKESNRFKDKESQMDVEIDENEMDEENIDEESSSHVTRVPLEDSDKQDEDEAAMINPSTIFGTQDVLLELKNIKSFSFFDQDSDSDEEF